MEFNFSSYEIHPSFHELKEKTENSRKEVTKERIISLLNILNRDLISFERLKKSEGVINSIFIIESFLREENKKEKLILRISSPHPGGK